MSNGFLSNLAWVPAAAVLGFAVAAIFSRMVARIPGWNTDSTYEEFLELARTLRGVAFSPKDG